MQASCGQDNSVAGRGLGRGLRHTKIAGRGLGCDKNAGRGRACASNFGPRATLGPYKSDLNWSGFLILTNFLTILQKLVRTIS